MEIAEGMTIMTHKKDTNGLTKHVSREIKKVMNKALSGDTITIMVKIKIK